MEKLKYKDLLKKLVDLNPKNEVLVTKHPFFPEKNEDGNIYPSMMYWIMGDDKDKMAGSFLELKEFLKFIDDEPIFVKYIQQGEITREQLETNLTRIYNSSAACVIRTIGRHIQVWIKEDLPNLIGMAVMTPFYNKGERKLQISPFELDCNSREEMVKVFHEIWDNKRSGDEIEDTVTDYEIISSEEFRDRIKYLRTLPFSNYTGL